MGYRAFIGAIAILLFSLPLVFFLAVYVLTRARN